MRNENSLLRPILIYRGEKTIYRHEFNVVCVIKRSLKLATTQCNLTLPNYTGNVPQIHSFYLVANYYIKH